MARYDTYSFFEKGYIAVIIYNLSLWIGLVLSCCTRSSGEPCCQRDFGTTRQVDEERIPLLSRSESSSSGSPASDHERGSVATCQH